MQGTSRILKITLKNNCLNVLDSNFPIKSEISKSILTDILTFAVSMNS